MFSSTVQYQCVGRKCVLLMTRIKQPSSFRSSLCYASHVVNNKLLPADRSTQSNYTNKGGLTTYQQRRKCQHLECVTLLMKFINFPAVSCHGYQSLSLLRTSIFTRNVSTKGNKQPEQSKVEEPSISKPEKLSLLQRFKQMYRDYWYVLVPVHLITSLGWFGGFYYLAKSGVDVIALLESMSISEKVINPLRDSSAGYIALSYALYKIATPIRYTVTLGGTTVSINYLKKWGYIKPIPPREELKKMYHEKKATLMRDTTEELKLQQEKLKITHENVMRGCREHAGKPEKLESECKAKKQAE